jgi:hypothetical protein
MTMQALTETAMMIAGELKRRTAERWGIAARIGWIRDERSRTERGEAARLRPWGAAEPSPETQAAIGRIHVRLAKARDLQ